MTVQLEEIDIYGTFRVGTTIDVISRAFAGFTHPWNKITYVRDAIRIHYRDTAGTAWKAQFDGGGWANTRMISELGVIDWQDVTGDAHPWNFIRGPVGSEELKSEGEVLYFKVINPFRPAGEQVEWLNIGYLSQLSLAYSGKIPNTDYERAITWTTSPFTRTVANPVNPVETYTVDEGVKEREFLAVSVSYTTSAHGTRPGLGHEQLVAIGIYHRDTWHPALLNTDGSPKAQLNPYTNTYQFGGYWTREYAVQVKGQRESVVGGPAPSAVFPSYGQATELTYCSGPGETPGSEGIWIINGTVGYIDPYNESGLRVWVSPYHNIGNYGAYLARDPNGNMWSDVPIQVSEYEVEDQTVTYWSGSFDFYNIGMGYPYGALTWAMAGGSNVVHGIDTSGTLFSKWYSYEGQNYRTVVQGYPAGAVDWVWSCPAYANTVIMALDFGGINNKHLIAVNTPPPPESYQEPFTPPGEPVPEIEAQPPWMIDPPAAAADSKRVTRW